MTSPQITKLEACQILYKGQSNVKLMADRLGVSLEEMQELFGKYVAQNPISDEAWKKDIDISWPYSGC